MRNPCKCQNSSFTNVSIVGSRIFQKCQKNVITCQILTKRCMTQNILKWCHRLIMVASLFFSISPLFILRMFIIVDIFHYIGKFFCKISSRLTLKYQLSLKYKIDYNWLYTTLASWGGHHYKQIISGSCPTNLLILLSPKFEPVPRDLSQ